MGFNPSTTSKPGPDNGTGRNGWRRSRNKNTGNSTQHKKHEKFLGLNKSELEGIVVCDLLPTPTSRQFDVLYDALVVYGGGKNPQVRTALRHLKPIKEKSLEPPKPLPSEYKKSDGEGDDDILRTALMTVWSTKATRATKIFSKYEQDLEALFGTVTGQLSKNILDTIEGDSSWEHINENNDTIGLIKLLREVCYQENHTKVNPGLDLLQKISTLIHSKQDQNKPLGDYIDEVKIRFDVVKACGGRLTSPEFTKYAINKIYADKNKSNSVISYDDYTKLDVTLDADYKKKKSMDNAVDQVMLAMIIINGSNDRMHRDLRQTLQDSFARGHDDYPITSTGAQDMLNQYKTKGSNTNRKGPGQGTKDNKSNAPPSFKDSKEAHDDTSRENNKTSSASQFVTAGSTPNQTTGTEPNTSNGASSGHKVVCVTKGSNKKNVNFCFTQIGASLMESTQTHADMEHVFAFAQKNQATIINRNWILLDSQATCNVICNKDLLTDIRKHPNNNNIIIHCNAGNVLIDTVGELRGFGTVWYHPDGIANCLSLALVSDRYRVTLDTSVSQSFFVHKDDGSTRRFDRIDCDLYACDVTTTNGALLAIVTVDGQKKKYSDLDVRRATKARKLQDTIGFPSIASYLKMIDNNLILNCPVTRRDVMIAEDIFGTNANIVKGKAVRQQPGHVKEDINPVPRHILKNYGDVTLAIDVYHINGIKFF